MSSDVTTPAALGGSPAFDRPLYYTQARVPDRERFNEGMDRVFASRWLTNNGSMVLELERRLTEHLGVGYCSVFCNGTAALEIGLRSLEIQGEVITTPFTFAATPHSIAWNGLEPVFCDIDPETYNIDVTKIEALITPRTSALVPVHVFGNPCDLVAIEELARHHGLKVAYDAAHAFDVTVDGRPIGDFGDLSMFSFHATKLFHTFEGGALVAPNDARGEDIAFLRNFGIANEEEVRTLGMNGKLSEAHAVAGLALLEETRTEIEARARHARLYRARLGAVPGIGFQKIHPGTRENHAYFTIEIDPEAFGLERNELHRALRAENVITRKYFHPLCSEFDCYRHLPSARRENLPNAHRVASRILCLPFYGDLPEADVARVIERIEAIHQRAPEVRAALAEVPAS